MGAVVGILIGILLVGGPATSPSFAAAVLVVASPFFVAIALAVRLAVFVRVTPEGLRSLDTLCRLRTVPWSAIRAVKPTSVLGLRYLRVLPHDSRFALWVPLQLSEYDSFLQHLRAVAPPDSPVVACLVGSEPRPLDQWFHVSFDAERVRMRAEPPGREAWAQEFTWASIERIVFRAEGALASDGIYVFTSERPESYAIPIEADGGSELWREILRRGLFDPELAIRAATSEGGAFAWPPLPE